MKHKIGALGRRGAALAALLLLAGCGGAGAPGLQKGGGHGAEGPCIAGDDPDAVAEDGADHDGAHGKAARVDRDCPDADRYTVGGTVSGATGTLVLDNLGLDTLPVTHDGPFTFTVALADGAPYEVTITNQPSAHARVCTVANGTGVVAGADVTDVAVVCAEAPSAPPADPPADPDDCADDCADTPAAETPETPVAAPEPAAEETPEEAPEAVPDATPDPAPEAAPQESPGEAPPAPAVEVGPRPDAAGWNDYVLAATGAPCDGTEAGPYGTCRHAGEIRAIPVPGRATCDGLSARDDLLAFDWTCEVRGGTAHMAARALREGVRLSDLLDFAALAWRDDALHVRDAGGEFYATAAGPWWDNPVLAAAGDLDVPGGVYLVAGDVTARFAVTADGVALVVAPGATLRGPGGKGAVVEARNVSFLWLEGRIDAAGQGEAVRLAGVSTGVLDGVRVQDAAQAGIHLLDARACRLSDVAALQNDAYGVRLDGGSGNAVRGLLVAGNALSGLHVLAGEDHRITDVTAAGNGNWGVALRATSGNVLAGVTAANHAAYGVWLDEAPGNTLLNIAAVNNGTAGVYLFASGGTLLANLGVTDNGFAGLAMNDSSDNRFTGRLLVGANPAGCYEAGGTRPGLKPATCEGTDGSDPVVVTGVSLAAAFVGPVTGDDPDNPDDTDGAAPVTDIADWTTFAAPRRHWAREAPGLPGAEAWGRCTAAACRIWDWALAAGDTTARGALAPPDGSTALAHAWVAGGTATFLANAVERVGDGTGNENVLCEAGEVCLVTPNLGSDQGLGTIVPAGVTPEEAAVPDVTLVDRAAP